MLQPKIISYFKKSAPISDDEDSVYSKAMSRTPRRT